MQKTVDTSWNQFWEQVKVPDIKQAMYKRKNFIDFYCFIFYIRFFHPRQTTWHKACNIWCWIVNYFSLSMSAWKVPARKIPPQNRKENWGNIRITALYVLCDCVMTSLVDTAQTKMKKSCHSNDDWPQLDSGLGIREFVSIHNNRTPLIQHPQTSLVFWLITSSSYVTF